MPKSLLASSMQIKSRYLFAIIVVVCMLIGLLSYRLVFDRELGRETERNRQHLETLSQSLAATLQKYDELPLVIAQDRRLKAALEQPNKSAMLMEANRYLEQINRILGTETIYAMNEYGLTLVSSNWNQPDSYIGDNYAFRPYFVDATNQGVGKFYGIGIASGKAGYYIAYPIKDDNKTLGVITIKIGLADIQSALAETKNELIVLNEDGVVILASAVDYRYKTTRALSDVTLERIAKTRQFPGQTLELLEYRGLQVHLDPGERIRLTDNAQYVIQSVLLGNRGWQIAQMSDTREARNYALASALALGFAVGFLLITWLNVYYRRREGYEKRQIYADIDAKITERTEELTLKINQLERAESVLRQTRDEAVQAGKMAALGQLAAGITHELSQPLSAIQLYAGNTQKFLEAGRLDIAAENIANITQLVGRAGSILSELKALYRNEPTALDSLSLKTVIRNSLLVMGPFLEKSNVTLAMNIGDELVMGASGKLEQVFINLFSNAIDVLAQQNERCIEISSVCEGDEVIVRFTDNGPGVPELQIKSLFEPFYTTKPSGQGLGLGLAITRFIVDAVGGRITCSNIPEGGLMFTIYFRVVKAD